MTNTTNAALVCIPEYLPPEPSTRRIPVETMSTMVYGPRRRPLVSRQVAFRAALLGAVIGLVGCATAPRPVAVEVETVGTLSASYNSIAVAPVHASTDLTPSFGAVDTDEDAPIAAPAVVEVPEVAQKRGLVVGEAR